MKPRELILHIGIISEAAPLMLSGMVLSPSADNVKARVARRFSACETTRDAAWAIHVSKSVSQDWLFLDLPGISELSKSELEIGSAS